MRILCEGNSGGYEKTLCNLPHMRLFLSIGKTTILGTGGIELDCGFKSSMLDAGYSMLDKDLLFTTDT